MSTELGLRQQSPAVVCHQEYSGSHNQLTFVFHIISLFNPLQLFKRKVKNSEDISRLFIELIIYLISLLINYQTHKPQGSKTVCQAKGISHRSW